MANQKKRNHYIPRVLLNRFASWSDKKRGKFKTWCYSKEWGTKELSTKDVALGTHFYGKEGILEDRLSGIEGELGSILVKIDEGRPIREFEKFLSEYAWVQSLRTRSFRVRVTRTISDLMTRLADALDGEDSKTLLRMQGEQLLKEEVSKLTPEQLALAQTKFGMPAADVASIFLTMMVESGHLSNFMQSGLRFLSQSTHLPEAMGDGLNKGISKMIEGEKLSPDNFRASWTVANFVENDLILGDSCIIAERSDATWQPVSDAVNWSVLYFPINPNRCLIGCREGAIPSATVDRDSLNHASATCSIQQFFSPVKEQRLLNLVSVIDSSTDVLSHMEKEEIAKSAWRI